MHHVANQHAGQHDAPQLQVPIGDAQHNALVEGEEEVGCRQLVEDDLVDLRVVVAEVGVGGHDGEVEGGRAGAEDGAVKGAKGLDVEVPEAIDGSDVR